VNKKRLLSLPKRTDFFYIKAYEFIDNNREKTMKVIIDVDPEDE